MPDMSAMQAGLRPHGFVYPNGMPPCNQCGEDPNLGAHVNPPRANGRGFVQSVGEQRIVSSATIPHKKVKIHRSHAYGTGYIGFGAQIPCQACKQPMGASAHAPGLPVGQGTGATPMLSAGNQLAAAVPITGKTLVTDVGGKLIISAPATAVETELLDLGWQTAAAKNPHFMWVEGAYVEAEVPNRNAAMWSTKDLEMGEPTVVNGPLNWLHEERHIIGSIAGSKLVHGTKDGERAHIRTLSSVWRYLYPGEARQIASASDEKKLWHSMECISREVSCLADGCGHTQPYADYMREQDKRCEHVKAGGPRRFVDPQFLGSAVILGAVRPGWAGAHAEVLRQAASYAESHEASLEGLTDEEAVHTIAQIFDYASGAAA